MPNNTLTSKQQAQLLSKLHDFFGDEEGGWAQAKEMLTTLRSEHDELKAFDFDQVLTDHEALKARQTQLEDSIRNSRKGFYISGLEDQEFSLVKTFFAVRSGNWDGAEHEKEILDQVREKRNKLLRGQTMHDDSLGGTFIPDQVIPDVIGAIYARSAFLAMDGDGQTNVSVLEGLMGGNVKIPKFNGGLVAYWIGDEDEYTESMVGTGDITMNPKKLGILVRLTDSMRRFPAYGFERLLRRDMEKAAATKIDWTIAYGSGTADTPRGLAAHADIQLYSAEANALVNNNATDIAAANSGDWQGATLDFDGLEEMRLLMEEDDIIMDDGDWRTVSSPRYYSNLRTLKIENYSGQTSGQPYLLGAPMIPESRLRGLIGDFGKTSQISSSALPGASVNAPTTSTDQKHTDVFAGDLSQCVVGRWAGIEIDDDGGKGKGYTSDHTYMKLRMYMDVAVREARAIKICPDAKVRA